MSRRKNITKEDIEREYLNVPRNINQACVSLGVSRKTLWSCMKKLGMKGKDHKWNAASRDMSSFSKNRKQFITSSIIQKEYLEKLVNITVAAKNIGCSVEFLRTSMKHHKIKAKKKSWNTDHPSGKQRLDITDLDRTEMVRLYNTKEASVRQIAEQYTLSIGATRSILVCRGVIMRTSKEGLSVRYPNGRFGEVSSNWRDGLSFLPYSKDFTEKLKEYIRERDNRECQRCWKTEEDELEENKRRLAVNHIDFDKNNCDPRNLNALCNVCNIKISRKKERVYWTEFFQKKQIERGIV